MIITARSRWARTVNSAALVVAAATALALSACTSTGTGTGTGTDSGTGTVSDTLTIAVASPPTSMDPTTAGNGLPLSWYSGRLLRAAHRAHA